MGEKELHKLQVTRLGGPHESRCTGLEKPLHGENRPGQCVVLDSGVRIGPMLQKDLDVFQMIHIRFGYWIITTFDVAVIGRQVQRRPAALIGDVHVGAVLNQIGCQLVVPVVGRG